MYEMKEKEFVEMVEILGQSLPTINTKERLKGLYHFFKTESPEAIRKAASEIARTAERFPTPAIFATYVAKHKSKAAEIVHECRECNNTGLIHAEREENGFPYSFVFKCKCMNAAKYPKIKSWTFETVQRYTRTDHKAPKEAKNECPF